MGRTVSDGLDLARALRRCAPPSLVAASLPEVVRHHLTQPLQTALLELLERVSRHYTTHLDPGDDSDVGDEGHRRANAVAGTLEVVAVMVAWRPVVPEAVLASLLYLSSAALRRGGRCWWTPPHHAADEATTATPAETEGGTRASFVRHGSALLHSLLLLQDDPSAEAAQWSSFAWVAARHALRRLSPLLFGPADDAATLTARAPLLDWVVRALREDAASVRPPGARCRFALLLADAMRRQGRWAAGAAAAAAAVRRALAGRLPLLSGVERAAAEALLAEKDTDDTSERQLLASVRHRVCRPIVSPGLSPRAAVSYPSTPRPTPRAGGGAPATGVSLSAFLELRASVYDTDYTQVCAASAEAAGVRQRLWALMDVWYRDRVAAAAVPLRGELEGRYRSAEEDARWADVACGLMQQLEVQTVLLMELRAARSRDAQLEEDAREASS